MKIQYLGHSSFRIISDIGTTIVTDPFNGEMVGYPMPAVSCDLVTCSHQHDDHNYVEALMGNPAVVDTLIESGCDDIAIDSFNTFHDDCQGKSRGTNIVYTFLVDGIKLAHLGDLGEKQESIAEQLEGTDILMIPVGGYYTIDAKVAKWYVDKINPKIVLPMHYRCADCNFNLISPLDEFCKLFDGSQVVNYDNDTLVIQDLPDYPQKVIILPRYCE